MYASYGLFIASWKTKQQEALTNVMNALNAVIISTNNNNNALEIRNALLCILRTVDDANGAKHKISPQLKDLMNTFHFSEDSLTEPQILWLRKNNLAVTSGEIMKIHNEIDSINSSGASVNQKHLNLIQKYEDLVKITIDSRLRGLYENMRTKLYSTISHTPVKIEHNTSEEQGSSSNFESFNTNSSYSSPSSIQTSNSSFNLASEDETKVDAVDDEIVNDERVSQPHLSLSTPISDVYNIIQKQKEQVMDQMKVAGQNMAVQRFNKYLCKSYCIFCPHIF